MIENIFKSRRRIRVEHFIAAALFFLASLFAAALLTGIWWAAFQEPRPSALAIEVAAGTLMFGWALLASLFKVFEHCIDGWRRIER